jgi:GTP-binding protein
MGDPVIMSAYHNLGLEDLMLAVQEMLPNAEQDEDQQDGPMRLAIIGRTNVGKSALVNAVLGQHRAIVSDVPGTTRDALDTYMEYAGEPVVLIDTAGIRRPGSIKRGIERYSVLRSVQAVQRCDIALLVMDGAELATSQDAHITGLAWDAFKGIIVVVNKSDLLPEDLGAKEMAVQQVRRTLHFAPYLPICFTSALERTGIDDLMRTARATYNERTQRVTAPELVRAMRQALAKNPHPSRKGKSILLEAVRQVDTNPPTFVFAVDNPTLVHFSYQRYLENHLRQWFGFTHTHLRLVFKRKT